MSHSFLNQKHIKQSYLITGGTGFVGQSLIQALIKDGHQVTLLTRDSMKAEKLFGQKVRFVSSFEQIDKNDIFDIVINLAGARIIGWRWTTKRKKILLDSRQNLTQKLVAWIGNLNHKPKLMLNASAIGYYGIQDQNDSSFLTEEAKGQNIFMSYLCQAWEETAKAVQQYGVPVVMMRFGFILGHQGALPPLLLQTKLGGASRLGSGKQVMSWIHIDDVVGIMAWLIRAQNQQGVQVFNFVAPKPVTQDDFRKICAKLLHRPTFLWVSKAIMNLLLGEQAGLLVEGQRVSAQKLVDAGYEFQFTDLSKAIENLI
ncbi:TIGR01777 family oxidoreductase [Neisseria sp. Ec49-e6-T10]|uniref:TIGR01777 family oxidoreductase n=1 Tax=Neisseria sp. Ec49-e6-T10 TaxID=3140744 RepID=UPI003EBF6B4C